MAVSQPCFELLKFFLRLPLPKGTGSYGTEPALNTGMGYACVRPRLCYLSPVVPRQLEPFRCTLHSKQRSLSRDGRDADLHCEKGGHFTLTRCGRKGGLGQGTPTLFSV